MLRFLQGGLEHQLSVVGHDNGPCRRARGEHRAVLVVVARRMGLKMYVFELRLHLAWWANS
jgi:hypothetical protein